MIKFLMVAISIFWSAQSVSAQNVGPMGFTWGAGYDQRQSVQQVDLSKKYDIFAPERDCALGAIEDLSLAPDHWKTDYRDYTSGSTWDVQGNSANADQSMGGRLTAYLYDVDVLGTPMQACGVFFDDQLYYINIKNEDFRQKEGLSNLAEDAISKNYGPEETYCGTYVCSTRWVSEARKVYISWSTSDGLSYHYGPIKAQQMKAWTKYYLDFVQLSTTGSDL